MGWIEQASPTLVVEVDFGNGLSVAYDHSPFIGPLKNRALQVEGVGATRRQQPFGGLGRTNADRAVKHHGALDRPLFHQCGNFRRGFGVDRPRQMG